MGKSGQSGVFIQARIEKKNERKRNFMPLRLRLLAPSEGFGLLIWSLIYSPKIRMPWRQRKESSRSGSQTGKSKRQFGFGRKRRKAMDTMTDHHLERFFFLNYFASAAGPSSIRNMPEL